MRSLMGNAQLMIRALSRGVHTSIPANRKYGAKVIAGPEGSQFGKLPAGDKADTGGQSCATSLQAGAGNTTLHWIHLA